MGPQISIEAPQVRMNESHAGAARTAYGHPPTLLFGGPLPWVDHNDGGYRCRSCSRTACPDSIPLMT